MSQISRFHVVLKNWASLKHCIFFVDENDRHVTVNGERYRAMLEDYLWPELDELDIKDMWFQQD